jgi:hypothetical protein
MKISILPHYHQTLLTYFSDMIVEMITIELGLMKCFNVF